VAALAKSAQVVSLPIPGKTVVVGCRQDNDGARLRIRLAVSGIAEKTLPALLLFDFERDLFPVFRIENSVLFSDRHDYFFLYGLMRVFPPMLNPALTTSRIYILSS